MTRTTLRGLLAHKLRLALAALAVVLGVAFVSGTLVLSDTFNHTFDTLFKTTTAGVDVQVRAATTVSSDERPPLSNSVVQTVRGVDGVKEAFGVLQRQASMIGRDGKRIANGGAPNLGLLWDPYPDLTSLRLRQGSPPHGAGEVVIDAGTASSKGYHVGDRVRILLPQGTPREFRISGITGFGDQDNLVGATLAVFDASVGQQLLGSPGEVDSISVKANPQLSAAELRSRVGTALPNGAEAITGQSLAQEQIDRVGQGIGFLSTALLVFAGVSLFVGSFIILNTFSILVAQRQKELALLRCLGASRRQVLTSVLLESLLTGVVASAVGVGVGVLLAIGLQRLLSAIGLSLSGTALQFQARTAIVGIVVGTLVTVVASVVPARRATRVAPVEAMRDSVPTSSAVSLRRIAGGGLLTVGGIAVLLLGLFVASSNQLSLTGLGALLVFIGVAVLAPLIAVPVIRLLGIPVGSTGVPGVMARQNALRQPRRTASTASALMVGVGLVVTFAVLAASLKASTNAVLDRTSKADFIITPQGFGDTGLTTSASQALRADTRAVASVSALGFGTAKIAGTSLDVIAVDPSTVERAIRADISQGVALGSLHQGDLAISEDAATQHGYHVGDRLSVQFPRPGTHQQHIASIFKHNALLGDYIITAADYRAGFVQRGDRVVLVSSAAGVTEQQVRAAITNDLSSFPGVQIQSVADYKKTQSDQIDQLLNTLIALLVLALVIALLGIVNTLVLSIVERTRELGLVRALGMEKRQMRTMVRWESVMIALLGTLLGLVVGVGFGLALVGALRNQGVDVLSVPASQLISYVVIAVLAGLLAAIAPARRAARIDMLRAITTE